MQPLPVLDCPRIKVLTVGSVGVGKSCLVKRYCEDRFVAKYIPTIGIDYGVKKFAVRADVLHGYRQRCAQEDKSNNSNNTTTTTTTPPFVRANFWDVAGGAEALEVRNEFYAATQGILLVYDVRDASSFAALDEWWRELSLYIALPAPGNTTANSSSNGNGRGGGSSNGQRMDTAAAAQLSQQQQLLPLRRTSTTANTPAGKAVGDTNGRAPVVVLCAHKVDDVKSSAGGGGGGSTRVVSEDEGRRWADAHGCAAYYETSASTGANVTAAMELLFYSVIARFM